jgi:predicted permease
MMDSIRRGLQRLGAFFHKQPLDGELDAEMASHVEMSVEEGVKRGLAPEEARRQALVRFGGVVQAKERQREERGLPWLDVLLQDLRFTVRTLRRDPGFAIVAVLILGLGIGANVAVFSVVNTLLLRQLPFAEASRLVWIEQADAKGLSGATYSGDAVDEYRAQNRSMEAVTAYMPFYGTSDYKLTGRGVAQPLSGVMVLGNFFQTLGITPMLGRLFTEKECVRGAAPVVVLGNAYWRRQFNGDRSIVGQVITLNDTPVTVVGVLPASFDFGALFDPGMQMDIFVPGVMDDMREWGNTLVIIGRMKPGVTVAEAQAEWNAIGPRLYFRVTHPEYGTGYSGTITGLKEHVSGRLRRSLIVLWCAVGMILLIVCVNLANLLIARAATRQKEFALRSALGAGRWRMVRQMATESLVLAGAGALLGLGLAYAVVGWLAHQSSIALPLLSSVRVDGTALVWTVMTMLLAAALFGVVPAVRVAGSNLQEALKESGHGSGEGRRHERVRSALVVSEVALACVLLVCAGLLLRSFLSVLDLDLGFESSRAGALKVDYSIGDTKGLTDVVISEKRGAALMEMLRRVKALPGVEAAGISDMLPLDRNRSWGFGLPGVTYAKGEYPDAFVYVGTPGYLGAMGIRFIAGRDLSWDDRADTQKVVVIDRSAAEKFWPGQSALGKKVLIGGDSRIVVGVVDDVRETKVEEKPAFEAYMPVTQAGPEGAELVVRSKLPPSLLAASLMSTLRQMNPDQPAVQMRPIQSLVDRSTSPRRFFTLLVGTFAVLGLVLASLGIYGVISYSVTQRTQEIGIRMALGASAGRVQMGVISKTLKLAAIGIGVGVVASMLVANLIASLLFGTGSADPITFAAVVVLLGVVALLAGYIPARRASRIDPMVALRNQ